MEHRHLGPGQAVVADRAHARDAARRRRQHGVGADAPQRVAHDQFGVAALAAGEARARTGPRVARPRCRCARRDVASARRSGRPSRRPESPSHMSHLTTWPARCVAARCRHRRSRRCTAGSRRTSSPSQSMTPLSSSFASAAGRAVRHALRIAALAAHARARSRRPPATIWMRESTMSSEPALRLRAGGHAVRCSRRSWRHRRRWCCRRRPIAHLHVRDISTRAVSCGAARNRSRTGAEVDAAQDQLPHHAGIEGRVDAEDAEQAVVLAARSCR